MASVCGHAGPRGLSRPQEVPLCSLWTWGSQALAGGRAGCAWDIWKQLPCFPISADCSWAVGLCPRSWGTRGGECPHTLLVRHVAGRGLWALVGQMAALAEPCLQGWPPAGRGRASGHLSSPGPGAGPCAPAALSGLPLGSVPLGRPLQLSRNILSSQGAPGVGPQAPSTP